jgi:hypothetical protein
MGVENGDRIQITLTPSESKKLISLAILRMENFRNALKKGMVVVHPSSTTYFLYERLTGEDPKLWVCGVIVPEGTCINKDMLLRISDDISRFSQFWVFKKGKLIDSPEVDSLVEELGPGDIYVKAANAVDWKRNAGVLIGAPDGKGTAGRFMESKRGFDVIIPVGLEKLIPSVDEAVIANPKRLKYSMGMPVYFRRLEGKVVTEVEALEILFNAKATPIASGGLSGAEGSTTLVVEGESCSQIDDIKDFILGIKGATIPEVKIPECPCGWKTCSRYDSVILRK